MPSVDQGGDRREPDRPAPEDRHALTVPDLGLIGGVHPDGQRLGEGGHVERQPVGHRVEPSAVGVGDEEQRSEPAFGPTVADAAELVVARLDDHPVTDPNAVTSAPTQSTMPAISWPRHIGLPVGPATPPSLM